MGRQLVTLTGIRGVAAHKSRWPRHCRLPRMFRQATSGLFAIVPRGRRVRSGSRLPTVKCQHLLYAYSTCHLFSNLL
jgi:hypothetical protein